MKTLTLLAAPVLVAVSSPSVAAQAVSSHQQHHAPLSQQQEGSPLHTPASIATEHRELHEILARASKESGEVGTAARELEGALSPHFKREEEIATPPLSLLPRLVEGPVTQDMRAVLPMTQALERELPQMLREHEAIRAAVARFRSASERRGKRDNIRFADQLAAHARQEEELLYPAAILVGRYVAQALSRP